MKNREQRLLVSVIIPIYSVEKYIRQCIESVIGQTYTDIEIILVDDGSPDACGEICDDYARKDERIIVIHKDNGGLISARKAGLAKATGTYVTFVDGDDFIQADMCQRMYEAAHIYNPDIIAAGFTFAYPDKSQVYEDQLLAGYYDKRELIQKVYKQMMCHDGSFQRGISPAVWCKWFRKSIISQVLPLIDERITDGEDAACTYPCLLRADSLFVCRDVCQYQYRVNLISMSRKYNKNWHQNLLYLFHWMDKIYTAEDRNVLGDSFNIEKFYTLYRYIDRELVCEEKSFINRIRTLRMIADFPEVQNVLKETPLEALNMTVMSKLKLWLFMKYR